MSLTKSDESATLDLMKRYDGDWDESKYSRDADGKFGSGGGGGSSKDKEPGYRKPDAAWDKAKHEKTETGQHKYPTRQAFANEANMSKLNKELDEGEGGYPAGSNAEATYLRERKEQLEKKYPESQSARDTMPPRSSREERQARPTMPVARSRDARQEEVAPTALKEAAHGYDRMTGGKKEELEKKYSSETKELDTYGKPGESYAQLKERQERGKALSSELNSKVAAVRSTQRESRISSERTPRQKALDDDASREVVRRQAKYADDAVKAAKIRAERLAKKRAKK